MAARLLRETLLGDYLLGGLRWAATVAPPKARERALSHYRILAGKGYSHLPFFFIADLSVLLEQGVEAPMASDARRGGGMKGWSDGERVLRLRYENQLLGRLLMEPAVAEARELLAVHRDAGGLSGAAYVGRLRRLMAILLAHFSPHVPPTLRINPAHLRGVILPAGAPAEAAERVEAQLGEPGLLGSQLEALVAAAQEVRWGSLLLDEDLFELTHHDTLATEAERIGCRQLIAVARRLGEIDPRQVAIADEGETETAFVDETQYPAGGLTGLTNRGSIESLVLSELVYIDRSLDIDLFDLRLMEGELLYYLRDDGVLRRKRRIVHLVLDAGEPLLRKPIGYDYQLSVIVAGMMLRLVWDLRAVFARDALTIKIHCLCPPGHRDRWADELALMRLLLRDETEHGAVSLELAEAMPPADFHAQVRDPSQKVYVVSFSEHRPGAWWGAAVAGLVAAPPTFGVAVALGDPDTIREGARVLPADGTSWSRLSGIKDDIAAALAGLRRHSGGTDGTEGSL
ncbi:MAG: hypothetical protein ACI8S6_003969 [Myxococcota bacterium]|jgi:hypothetical protein